MATIVTRAGKGSALTFTEMDANFTGLNTDLATISTAASPGAYGIRMPAGSAATPSISFAADTNTGVYSAAADTIGLSAQGATALTLAGVASGVNYVAISNAATAGAPSLTATGSDSNISINLATKGTTGQVYTNVAFSSPNFNTNRTGALRTVTHPSNSGAGTQDNIIYSAFWSRIFWNGTLTRGGGDSAAAESGFQGVAGPNRFFFQDGTSCDKTPIAGVAATAVFTGVASGAVEESQRNIVMVKGTITGAYGTPDTVFTGTAYMAICGQQIELISTSGQGGVGGYTPGDNPRAPIFRGSYFGLNVLVSGRTGTDNLTELVGAEVVMDARTATIAAVTGLHIGKKETGTARAAVEDVAIDISSNSAAAKWMYGIQFGRKRGASFPFQSDSTLIGAVLREFDVPTTRGDQNANYGVDFRNVTFATAAFASNGFSVSDAGTVTTNAIQLATFTVAQLNAAGGTAGAVSYASNGRKNGEGVGSGTGVLCFHDGTAWRACDTGATIAA